MWFTITFDAGTKKGIPVELEASDEAEVIAVFKEFLRSADADGWINDFQVCFDGEPMHTLVFEPKWISTFEVFEGKNTTYGHRYGR